jgi:integration host factor subunit beta
MTRSDLVAHLAARHPHLRRADIELIVATIFDQITEALARGQREELRGFGALSTKQRKARAGHNPRNGEEVSVAAKTALYFRAGRELRSRVNLGAPLSPTQSVQRGSWREAGTAKK